MQHREGLQHQVVAGAQVRALVREHRAELGRREAVSVERDTTIREPLMPGTQ